MLTFAHIIVNPAQTSSLKTRNFKGSQDEWDQILANVLLGTTAEASLLDGLEVTANADGKRLKINIRKRIGDIAVREFNDLIVTH